MEKLHEAKEVDTALASRGVWLVKVPKYLADRWAVGTDAREIGTLTIQNRPNSRPEVSLRIPERLAAARASEPTEPPCPTRYRLSAVPSSRQQLLIYSQQEVGASFNEDGAVPELSDFQLKIEGHVNHRAECTPDTTDKKYLEHKLEHVKRSNKPTRQVQHITNIVQPYKPKSSHASRQNELRNKEMTKRTRDDPDLVRERVYKAFEKHQYYNIRDLVNLTQQPVSYLKEILKDTCNYNMRAPHRNMWELKPEYRHYSKDT